MFYWRDSSNVALGLEAIREETQKDFKSNSEQNDEMSRFQQKSRQEEKIASQWADYEM